MTDLTVIQQQKKFNILLIGDSCVDEYIYGTVERLNPEAPVPILKQSHKKTNPGMAANVKHNLEKLNCEVDFITNMDVIVKTRYMDEKSGYNLLRVDQEDKILPWSGKLYFDIDEYDAIVISDYDKGFLTYDHIEMIQNEYKSGRIFLDTKKTDLKRFESCFVKINNLEYSKIKSECSQLIVTQGKNGAMFKGVNYPSPEVEVFDVCGAGDTFLSSLTYKYLLDKNLPHAIHFANKAASITIQHLGVYAPTLEEIQCV